MRYEITPAVVDNGCTCDLLGLVTETDTIESAVAELVRHCESLPNSRGEIYDTLTGDVWLFDGKDWFHANFREGFSFRTCGKPE